MGAAPMEINMTDMIQQNSPLVFLGSSSNLELWVELAERAGVTIIGIIDSDYFGNTDNIAGIPIIGSQDQVNVLLDLATEDRAREGLFLAFQYPVEIPGVSNINFLRAALNEIRDYKGEEQISAKDFMTMVREKSAIVELDAKLASRSVNEGFSGGEKKRNEIFQMAMLNPKLAILDETDSGLDIDALRIVANGVNKLKTKENATIVITHYQRLLDYIVPDFVHVLYDGQIVKTGTKELALELEERGYDWIKEEFSK